MRVQSSCEIPFGLTDQEHHHTHKPPTNVSFSIENHHRHVKVDICGDKGIRTPDLRLAKAPLSQLSYIPKGVMASVGLARLEHATSRLSGVRSSQLSYRPVG